jgi:MoxR-like ATPase
MPRKKKPVEVKRCTCGGIFNQEPSVGRLLCQSCGEMDPPPEKTTFAPGHLSHRHMYGHLRMMLPSNPDYLRTLKANLDVANRHALDRLDCAACRALGVQTLAPADTTTRENNLERLDAELRVRGGPGTDEYRLTHAEAADLLERDLDLAASLSDRQYSALHELENANAYDIESRQTIEKIARAAEGPKCSQDAYRRPVAGLSRLGLVQTKGGRQGGCWLTSQGRAFISSITSA